MSEIPLSPQPPPDETNSLGRPGLMSRLVANPTVIGSIWLTSAILNVLFLASIIVLGVSATHNSDALHNSSVSQCRANNTNRHEDTAIWDKFLGDIAPPSVQETPKIKAELMQINALIKIKDTPRNCVKVYAP